MMAVARAALASSVRVAVTVTCDSAWSLAATARVAMSSTSTLRGSAIVNESNARYFEPAPGCNDVLKLTGRYAF